MKYKFFQSVSQFYHLWHTACSNKNQAKVIFRYKVNASQSLGKSSQMQAQSNRTENLSLGEMYSSCPYHRRQKGSKCPELKAQD